MKLLVLSNFYPPHYLGGYELGCRDVVEGLRARGHEVVVLTSQHGSGLSRSDNVHRVLQSAYDWDRRFGWRYVARILRREVSDGHKLRALIGSYQPDLIYVWNILTLPLSLVMAAQRSGKPVVHLVSDETLTRWDAGPWYRLLDPGSGRTWRRAVLRFVAAAAGMLGLVTVPRRPDLTHAQFVSHYLRQLFLGLGFHMQRADVMHWGVGDAWFRTRPSESRQVRLLYAGRLSPEKAVETPIAALGHLNAQLPDAAVTLTIAGGSGPAEYEAELRSLVARLGLTDSVSFVGKVEREQVRDLYARHDVFLLPAIWQEPFSIALVEGMAAGLVPVGTLTGGTAEILQADDTGLVFEPGDSRGCARQLQRLVEQPELRRRLAERARRVAAEHFRLDQMVDNIEQSLLATVASARASSRPSPRSARTAGVTQ